MSYILDALNKAERERKRGRAPAVDGSVMSVPSRAPGNPWLWIALLAVVFNAVLAGLLVWSSLQDKEVAGVAKSTAVDATVPELARAEPDPIGEAASATARTAAVAEPVAPAAAPIDPLTTIRPAQPIKPASTLPLMTDAELQQQAREKELEEQRAAEPVIEPTPQPPARSMPPLESIPLQIELRPELQQALPPLRVDVHVYDDAPANRFVMINLRRYREGDEIADDLILERVTREGMVLKFRDQRFRLLMQ